MNKNMKIITLVVAFILVGGGSFYGGMMYGKSTVTSTSGAGGNGQFRNGNFAGRNGGGANGGQFTTGQILSKDTNSITIQLRNGGSQIVFMTDATPVMKAVAGSAADLTVGDNVMVSGTKNNDGSLTAQNIQIRPSMPNEQNGPSGNANTNTAPTQNTNTK